ncbi:MAG: hypothetical protein FJ395_16580 [Verrucomicrobia bacterium]|nr:hypothetical protein [Verrucomicrobiota bacterium]
MTTAKSKTKLWPPIHELTYTSGQTAWQVACMIGGKRIREAYPTKAEAETRAAEIRLQVENEGKAGFDCPVALRVEAVECEKMLQPFKASIRDACQWYVKHVLKFRAAPTVTTALAEIIENKTANGRRHRTIRQFKFMADRFALTFGTRRLSEITGDEIRAWLNDDKTHGKRLSPVSKINYLVAIGNIFTHGIRKGYCDTNPVKAIDRPSREAGDVHFLTVEQVAALLIHAEQYELVPYVALGVFAGLRPERELRLLDWQKVNITERTIRIDASLAKTRQRRIVEISDALAAYLTPYAKRKGAVVPFDEQEFRTRWEKCRDDAGVKDWPHDAMRHTYATFSLAQENDIGKLSLMMGNSATVIHSNYKGLVSKADAERFWSLRPASDADNKIVTLKAANA